ncbi:hypothetical protein [Spirosoma sp.]
MKKAPFFLDKPLALSTAQGWSSLLAILLYVAILLAGTLLANAFQ